MGGCDRRSHGGTWSHAWRMGAVILTLAAGISAPRAGAQGRTASAITTASGDTSAQAAVGSPASGTPAAGVVNLNTASLEQLTLLPGIGPVRARAVLELRARLKRFARVADLMRVRGIGRKTFRKLAPMLTLEGETTLTSRAAPRCRQAPRERESRASALALR